MPRAPRDSCIPLCMIAYDMAWSGIASPTSNACVHVERRDACYFWENSLALPPMRWCLTLCDIEQHHAILNNKKGYITFLETANLGDKQRRQFHCLPSTTQLLHYLRHPNPTTKIIGRWAEVARNVFLWQWPQPLLNREEHNTTRSTHIQSRLTPTP